MEKTARDKIKERRQKLVTLIENGRYENQEQLVQAFQERGWHRGLNVSQSTLSRDIKVMKIPKHEGVYIMNSELTQDRKKGRLAEILEVSNAHVHHPVNFFCVKCDEGYEQLLAARIREVFEDIIGTVIDVGMVVVYALERITVEDLTGEVERIVMNVQSTDLCSKSG